MDHTYVLCNPNEVSDKKNSSLANVYLDCMRFNNIYGYDNRKNDIIYCRPETGLKEKSVAVFFGGDIQDFLENMEKNKYSGSKEFLKWNLESTAYLLHTHFPDKHIVVVKPSRMDFSIYSCFQNFVPVIKYGAPKHIPMNNALEHLNCLLKEITWKIKQLTEKETETVADLDESDLTLIGFSKGCVVLNQFLYEFHYVRTLTPDDKNMTSIISRIKNMYWLDGGHSGGKNTWITSRSLLETLTNSGIKVYVHVTPYQICDSKRRWIASEERMFTELLKEMNADIERTLHFQDDDHIHLSMHFELLSVFKQTSHATNSYSEDGT